MYDKFIQWALNNITIVAIVLISSILMALPQIIEGCKSIYNLFRLFLREKPFVSEYADEVITFEEKLISYDFDIVKIRGMEIQANKFAGYILVPTGPLKNYFRIILKNLSIYKESLILDNQPCNKELVNSILVQLSNIFNVSCEVIKYRLEQEKLLAINQNSPQRIRNIMRQ